MTLPGYAKFPLVLLGLALVGATLGHLSAGETSTADPLPFDPLSESEQADAIAVLLDDARFASHLSDRFVVIGASLNTDKDAMRQADPPRRADVQVYDYVSNLVTMAIVNLDSASVVTMLDVPQYQPALTGAEMARAAALAADAPGVDARLPGEHDIVRASHLWTGTDSGCPERHRCVIVGHYINDFPDFAFFVLVDLSDDRVIDTIENHWWTAESDREVGA